MRKPVLLWKAGRKARAVRSCDRPVTCGKGTDRLQGMRTLPGAASRHTGTLSLAAACFRGYGGALSFFLMARAQPGAEGEGLGAPALPVVQGQGGLQQALGGGVLACQHQYPFGGFPGAGAEGQDAAAAQTLPFQRGEQAGQFRSREDAAEQAVMAQQAPGRMAEHGQRIRHAWLFPGPPGSGRPVAQESGAAQGGITPGTG